MRPTVSPTVLDFVQMVRHRTGNVVSRSRYSFLEELLQRRARALDQPDVRSYIQLLTHDRFPDEWQRLIPLVTIKESYFFRAPQQFRELAGRWLPQRVQDGHRKGDRRLRVWSAACARGEEPGTLAIVLAESGLPGAWEWEIIATDVDDEALEAARRGLYGERAVAHVPDELRERYFTRRGQLYELSSSLRERIRYRHLNLTRVGPSFEGPFDLVFLRNVLIYFPRPVQRRVVREAAQRLTEDGWLFLGASETLWQIDDRLMPVDLGSCFVYRHPKPGEAPRPAPPVVRSSSRAGRSAAPAKPPEPRPTRPAPPPERIEAAVPESLPAPEPVADEPEVSGAEPFEVPERLGEAATALADNRLDEAAELLEEARKADPSEPAVYALEGFLADLGKREEDAITAYRAALYLDPSLFQARVLLADCLRRTGALSQARRHYREALASLETGRERELVILDSLPLPNRVRAERRCRQVLRGR